MFKKSGSCQSKAEAKLRGKELKALRAALANAFRLNVDELDLLLPTKKGRDVAVRRLGGGVRTELLCLDGVPMLIDPGSKGKSVNLCPTLAALWLVPRALPVVQIHPPVSKYVISGSDLMMPGVHSVLRLPGSSESDHTLSTGSYVAIAVAGNPMPLAVGKLLFDPLSAGAEQGRVVESVHFYGDVLWETSGKTRPNEGFLDQIVMPIGPVEFPKGYTPAGADEEDTAQGEREEQDEDDAEAGENPQASSSAEGHARAAQAERLSGLQQQDNPSTTNSNDELDALVQKELDSDDELDALVAAELDAEAEAEVEAELEPEQEAIDAKWPRTAEEMDEHLEICFLQAARTRLHKKKSLPLDAAVVYAGHMRKVRRVGTDLDVKRSSHKKLLTFLHSLERKGWIELKVDKGVATLVAIDSSNRDIRKYQPYPASETAEADEATNAAGDGASAGTGSSSAKATLSVTVVYQTTSDTRLLFAAVIQREEEVELARRREQATHEHEVAAAETGQRYRCVEGCDYDVCEECRTYKHAVNDRFPVVVSSGDNHATGGDSSLPSSFLAVQQEQEQEASQKAGSSLAFGTLDDVETRPYYTEVECYAFLQNYARLFRVPGSAQNKKILLLDDLLTQVLYGSPKNGSGGQSSPSELHQKSALSLLLKRMRLSHKIAKRGVGERTSVRVGSPNPLHVKTESRKNHNLTLVTGLENFGIDPSALANMVKRRLGANTTVGEWKAKSGAAKAEVAVSGLWEKSVADLLVVECGVDKRFIEVVAKKSLAEKSKAKKKK